MNACKHLNFWKNETHCDNATIYGKNDISIAAIDIGKYQNILFNSLIS